MKKVAVFGGSFNPPHEGHFEMGRYIHKATCVDEVWLMFSLNRFKDPAKYAPLADRMAMGQLMADQYADAPFVMSDIEARVGTNETYFVMKALQEENPDCRFIWVMGADNLAEFHTWSHADDFMREFSIAVVDRPPYTQKALDSPMVQRHALLQVDAPEKLAVQGAGWCFLKNPGIDVSSTALLQQMRDGRREFSGPFQDVANYIVSHDLYDLRRPEKNLHKNGGPS